MPADLASLLLESQLISEADLRQAVELSRSRSLSLAQALVQGGQLNETQVARAEAKLHGLPFVDLSKGRPPKALLDLVPAEFCRDFKVLPVAESGGKLIMALADPLQRALVDQLEFQLGRAVGCALAAPAALTAAVEACYGSGPTTAKAEAKDQGEDAPLIRLVNRLFADALKQRASDIHLEPHAGGLRVRLRIDGVLRTVADQPPHLSAPLLSRLKVMGSMDIAERRKPQDGRIAIEIEGRPIDVRVSILPSNHGETMVMRLLDRSANLIGLPELGFLNEDQAWFQRLIARPHGIVLVTGPTGSGKTTTLYGALAALNRSDVKILTAEDPVEYHITGINQVQVNPKQGLSFARILRAMLRAAPNVILVGEIRDLETAEVAIQAALTGHLVFSTLHTNDAPSAVTRLIDMGVAPFLVSAALQGVVAQRLVRRLCASCAKPGQATEEELLSLGLPLAPTGLKRPTGCTLCEGSGFKGRIGLFELFEMDPEGRDLIFQRASLERLRSHSLAAGKLRPLLVDGARKVVQGLTAPAEVLRVTRAAASLAELALREGS
jgi:general secretion pathway protein E/type IV pilus assembly protein PilB